jgi:hypothetical protein
MALINFIPTVWSENLLSQMDKKYIAVSNCNRDFEGDIKARGDRVKVCGVGAINVFNYENGKFTEIKTGIVDHLGDLQTSLPTEFSSTEER